MRLPLIPKCEVAPFQKALYDAFAARVGRSYSTFETMREDGALLGPWGVWIHTPKTGEAIRQLIEAIEAMPGLSREAVQVAILLTGAHFDAAYELYAHAAVAAQAGLSDIQVATLCAGEIPNDLDAESTLAGLIAKKLLAGGTLPGALYKEGVARLGQDAFNHLVYVVGQYCLVSMTLNAFDVPADN